MSNGQVRLGALYRPRDERARTAGALPLLSVSQTKGVLPRDELTGDAGRAEDLSNYKICRAGDIVINRMSAYNGAVGVAGTDGLVSPDYLVLEPGPDGHAGFISYWLRSDVGKFEILRRLRGIGTVGTTQVRTPRVNESDLRLITGAFSTHSRQAAIAEYLDRETAKIDTLIAKQEALIAALAERRQATVSEKVTRGTDPTVELGRSSLDWADAIPAHWQALNIRRVAEMKTGHTPSRSVEAYWEDTTIPWFTLADVWQLRDGTQTYLGETANKISESGLANSAAERLPANTVVLSRTASVGFSGIMPVEMATSQDFWNWVCGPRILPEYLMYTFRAMRDHLLSLMIGSTHKTIYQPMAAALRVPVPPLDEQQGIVDRISSELAAIDALAGKARRVIALAKERRAALITAAVTGDVSPRA